MPGTEATSMDSEHAASSQHYGSIQAACNSTSQVASLPSDDAGDDNDEPIPEVRLPEGDRRYDAVWTSRRR